MKKLFFFLFLIIGVHAFAQAATPAKVGQTVIMTVTADGTAPFTYVWFKDGKVIPGATLNAYTISSAALTDAGNYTAQVNNSSGSYTTNTPAVISVTQLIVAPTNAVITVTVTPAPKTP